MENNQTAPAHRKVRHGLCPVCSHYGDDCTGSTAPAYTHFDGYEVHGVKEYTGEDGTKFCEQVDDGEAMFWSLYGHLADGGLLCIGDFQTREDAEEVMARITGASARLFADAPLLLGECKQALYTLRQLATHPAFADDAPEFNEGGIGKAMCDELEAVIARHHGKAS